MKKSNYFSALGVAACMVMGMGILAQAATFVPFDSTKLSNQGDILLRAVKQSHSNLSVEALDNSIEDLGDSVKTDVDFGTFTIDDNSYKGFNVTIGSLNSGKLVLDGGLASNTSEYLSYQLKLQEVSGILAVGLSHPAFGSNDSLSSPKSVAYSGSSTSKTAAYKVKLMFSTPEKYIAPGLYKDTITVTVSDV